MNLLHLSSRWAMRAATIALVVTSACQTSASSPAPSPSSEATPDVPARDGRGQQGFYRMKLGDLQIIVVSDGTATRDVTELVTKIPNDEVRRLASAGFRDAKMQLSINAFLVNRAGHLVLVDAGAGDLFKPEGGLLVRNLRAAGYDPDTIEAVILSHIHADHSGGLILGGTKTFPNATVYVPAPDYDLFLDPDEKAKASEKEKHVFQDAETTLGPYVRSGRAKRYSWNTEIVEGIKGAPAAGHTPGHTYLTVESKGEKLVILGDTIHVAEVQFERPEAAVILDRDQDAAVAQRRRGLAAVAAQGSWVAFQHVSFPGLGHVRNSGDGFAWIPAAYEVPVLPPP